MFYAHRKNSLLHLISTSLITLFIFLSPDTAHSQSLLDRIQVITFEINGCGTRWTQTYVKQGAPQAYKEVQPCLDALAQAENKLWKHKELFDFYQFQIYRHKTRYYSQQGNFDLAKQTLIDHGPTKEDYLARWADHIPASGEKKITKAVEIEDNELHLQEIPYFSFLVLLAELDAARSDWCGVAHDMSKYSEVTGKQMPFYGSKENSTANPGYLENIRDTLESCTLGKDQLAFALYKSHIIEMKAPRSTYAKAPIFPRKAQRKKQGGCAHLQFTVNTMGLVSDIEVLKTYPDNTFVLPAINAVHQHRYHPSMNNGKPVKSQAKQNVAFEISDGMKVNEPVKFFCR